MDEIRRKLALIDEQLAHGGLRRRLASTAPLFFPALGLMAGIVLQDGLLRNPSGSHPSLSLWLWLIALAFVATATGAYFIRHRSDLRPEVFAYGALLGFTCLGAIRLLAYEKADPCDIRNMVGPGRVLATFRGQVLTQPRLELQDWCFAQMAPADPSSAFYLRLDGIKTPAGWQQVVGTIRVQVDEPVPNLKIGDHLQAYCWLHRFEEPTNPGQFNFAEYLRLRNVSVGASVPVREAIEVRNDGPKNAWIRLRSTFTSAAATGLLGHPFSETQSEAMIEALLLGERHNIDRDINEAFRKTGLLHLISLSGMHLSILIGLIWWSCKPAGFSKRTRAVICMLATAVFLIVVPLQGPILRAAVIVWAYCASILLRRRSNAINSLSLAVVVLLLIQPTQLFDAGWQLSFASVAGILALTHRIEDFAHERTRNWFHRTTRETSPAVRLLKKTGTGIITVLSVGTAAWLASAGILLYHFYNITPLASVWTALASPPVTAITVLGFVKIIVSFFLPTASMILGHVLDLLAELLIRMVKVMAWTDFSYIQIGHVPLLLIVLYYALILFAAFIHLRRPILKRGLCAALALVVIVPLGFLKWQRTHRDCLSLTCLDVGHGQAILAQLPGTTNVLFDAGSLYNKDIGARIVTPFMDYIGAGRLHAIIASHYDVDHLNGIPEVVDLRRPDCVYLGDTFFGQSPIPQTTELLMQHLETSRIKIERVPQTMATGPAQVQVLWPTDESTASEELSENDKSLVCLIEFADRRVLLCSDIEKPAQGEILRRYPSLKADVVVAPHHGSVRTLDDDFLRQLEPRLVICSCSRTDFERGRVTREVEGAVLLCTAQAGALNICIDAAGAVQVSPLTNSR
ncbi:MAG: DNA internalization-related competence protein ComEC/Rec2 [Phycisphaerae bacterium]|nr:DNA internalization-related competence protein ComEC/Rec2 [Phycisphaerae bacterium]